MRSLQEPNHLKFDCNSRNVYVERENHSQEQFA